MTIDFTKDKIELIVDVERQTILISAKGRKRKIARFTPRQVGQISKDGYRALMVLYARAFAKTRNRQK